MKRFTLAVVSLLATGMSFAQTLPEAIKKTDNERYEEAAKDFRSLVNQAGISIGDVYFFYGENFFQSDDKDSAKIVWKKGLELDPENAFAKVGNGKSTWISGDTTAANVIFTDILKATKRRNAEVMRQIAAVYIESDVKSLNQAVALLNEAIKLEPKNQMNYLLLGDAQIELNQRNSTEGMKSYNKAGEIANNARVFVRKAKIYQRAQNPKLADSLYMVAQTLEPNYAPAYRERADLNMRFNMTKQSIAQWEKYLALNDSEYARYRYATSLFLGKYYKEAAEEVQKLKARNFSNIYTQRIYFYAIYEANNAANAPADAYTDGYAALNKFFETTPADKITGSDIKYKALYHQAMGQVDQYLIEMENAAAKEPTIAKDIYGDLAKHYMKEKVYDKVIDVLNKKMAGDSANITLGEHFEMGRAYYFGPQDFAKVDAANAYILKSAPSYAMSELWRGRAKVKLDGDNKMYSAKPHYENFLTLLKEEEINGQFKSMALEALYFLGDYYISSPEKDLEKASEVWNRVKTLNPEDSRAKAYFSTVKK